MMEFWLGDNNNNSKTITARTISGPCVGIYDENEFNREVLKVLQDHPGAKVEITKSEYECIPTAKITW